jgi:predicted nucleic acid-binding protein
VPSYLLDTSVLIGTEPVAPGLASAISVVSIAELHFGLLRARDDDQRAQRAKRLGLIEARYPEPVPIDDLVAREWGGLLAAVANRGAQPRRRSADFAIAATALALGATLLTHNVKDFAIVADLLDVRAP